MTPFDEPPRWDRREPRQENTAGLGKTNKIPLLSLAIVGLSAAGFGTFALVSLVGGSKSHVLVGGYTNYPQGAEGPNPVSWDIYYDTAYDQQNQQGPWRFERSVTLPDGSLNVENFPAAKFQAAYSADLGPSSNPVFFKSYMQEVATYFARHDEIPLSDIVRLNSDMGQPDGWIDVAAARLRGR